MTQSIVNKNAEIQLNTRIKTDFLIKNNWLNIFVYDKRRNKITLICRNY